MVNDGTIVFLRPRQLIQAAHLRGMYAFEDNESVKTRVGAFKLLERPGLNLV